jgi:hypothetical protein
MIATLLSLYPVGIDRVLLECSHTVQRTPN